MPHNTYMQCRNPQKQRKYAYNATSQSDSETYNMKQTKKKLSPHSKFKTAFYLDINANYLRWRNI